MKAEDILTRAVAALARSGREYDTTGNQQERSAKRIAEHWKQMTGNTITQTEVWQFAQCVKMARLETSPDHEDSMVDLVAYKALELESRSEGGAE